MFEVARYHKPDRKRFLKEILPSRSPALLTGLVDSWPAFGKWTPEYFERIGAEKPVRIEFGNVLQETPRFAEWNLGRYMRHLREREGGVGAQSASGSDTGDDSAIAVAEGIPYLAYFDIFAAFPALRADVDFSFWKGRIKFPIGWIGPAGSYTGLHYDIADNLFAAFHGSKEFTLYPPAQSAFLYPGRKYDIGSVLSEVDARRPEAARFPLFARAEGRKVLVTAGDILFTPRGWWHEVLGLENSISVSCFGFGIGDTLLRGLPGAAKHALHLAGLYRKGNCACHLQASVAPRNRA